jgi:hypothetical protein
MDKKLAAWRENVEKLLALEESLPAKDPQADARQRKELQSLVADIGRASNLLKFECLPA